MFSATKGGSTAGYQISRSVRLRSSASAYFNRTLGSGSQTTWTFSTWFKRGDIANQQVMLSCGTGATDCYLNFPAGGTVSIGLNGTVYRATTQVLRDPSAWYHLVFVLDTTNATAQNRARLYINGVEVTAWGTNATITQNATFAFNSAVAHNLGRYSSGASLYVDGYLTEINFIDGQALTPSSFGETNAVTGVWQPKKYTGTYGTNGFYLNFSDNSSNTATTIGKDYSGNGNNWTPNNISVTAGATYDSMLDVPTQWADGGNGRGNYATLNPLLYMGSGSTKSNGNLRFVGGGTGGPPYNYSIYGTFVVNAGKWYWETTITTAGSQPFVGMFNTAINFNGGSLQSSAGPVLYGYDGKYYNETTGVTFGNTYTTGDVIGIAVDFDNNLIWFSKNGTWQNSGDPSTGTNGKSFGSGKTWAVGYVESGSSTSASTFDLTFGQRPFAYTPPSGFKALNTLNLPTPTILKGGSYFNTVLYTGNGGTLSVTGVGFQPDFVWLKSRGAARSHRLWDAVRGATNGLSSDLTNAEYVESGLTAFNSDGFTLGSQSGSNTNAESFVAWNWKEGATQGFDIVTYTGTGNAATTVAHGLGVVPAMIITKRRNNTGEWMVKHRSLASNLNLILNQTSATYNTTVGASGGLADLTSSTTFGFVQGSSNTDNSNANGGTYVAYLFAEVAGFSKFGSYTGNGSTDGPFVFCGFRPRFVMIKASGLDESWYVYDSARNTYNVMDLELNPNNSGAEAIFTTLDFVSNGFKLRTLNSAFNSNGATYIFMAMAENPFKNSLAR